MRCDRCGYAVPEWLWLGGDHPILVQAGTKVENLKMLEQNIFRVSTTETVQIKMCSEVNHILARQDAAKRSLEEAEANAKALFHIPDWICEKCKTQYNSDVPRINCCPTHNMVICYKCKDELHPEEIKKGADEQEQSVRSSPSFVEAVSSRGSVSEVRTAGGTEGEASAEPEVGLTAVCPNCKRSVDYEREHWLENELYGAWKCEQRRATGGAEGEASTKSKLGLTAVCPKCKRSVDHELEHWAGTDRFDPEGHWACQLKETR